MRARWFVAIAVTTSMAHAEAPNTTALRPQVAKITGAVYQGTAFQTLSDLSERGPRLTGTAGYTNAVQWALRELRAAGLQDVRTEKVKLAATWQRGTARGRIIAPSERTLDVMSFGWSPSTPAGGVKGPVVVLDNLDPAVWKPLTPRLRGAIVVVAAPSEGKVDDKTFVWLEQGMSAWAKAGVQAVVLGLSKRPNNLRGAGGFADTITPLPVAMIGYEDASHIARKADGGLRIELVVTNTVGGPTTFENVIGEIKGTDPAAGWLLVGAHLDSWDLGSGTQDNGSGVVSVIETVRALAASGPLKRTVRFALWGGEEQFIVGSRAYAAAHASELGSCVAVINSDSGAGHVTGWYTGREDVKAAIAPTAKTFLAGLGGATISTELGGGSDHEAFALAGVPTLLLAVDEAQYDTIHHKVADTIEKVDRHAFLGGIAVVAVTTYALAMSTTPFAPRLDRAGIEQLFTRAGSLELMRSKGVLK